MFSFNFYVNAEYLDLSKPFGTELVNKTEDKENKLVIYEYQSKLSKEQIIKFYHSVFKNEKFEEKNTKYDISEKNTFFFVNELKQKNITLTFMLFSEEQGKITRYALIMGDEFPLADAKDKYPRASAETFISAIFQNISDPRKLDFMPVYPNSKQFEYLVWENPPSISIAYLANDDADLVQNFMITNMPSFGWKLTDREPHIGRYAFSEWVAMVAPYSNFCTKCYEYNIPLLKIKGITLTFQKESKKCIVTIHTFDDAVELSKSTTYDLTAMEDYGSTVIGIVYFYDKK